MGQAETAAPPWAVRNNAAASRCGRNVTHEEHRLRVSGRVLFPCTVRMCAEDTAPMRLVRRVGETAGTSAADMHMRLFWETALVRMRRDECVWNGCAARVVQ